MVAVVACVTCMSWSEAQAGRGRHCHCQPMYTNTTTYTAAPMAPPSVATTDSRVRYQSAYEAPAPATTFQATRPAYYDNTNGFYDNGNYRESIDAPGNRFQNDLRADRKAMDGRMRHSINGNY